MKLSRIILTAGLLVGTAAVIFAGPPSQVTSTSHAMTAEQIQKLKAGDQIAYVCKQCDSVTVETLEKTEQAMTLCKVGAYVVCPACKKKFKVILMGPSVKSGITYTQVRYVNEKGEDCMFVAKLQK